MIGIGINENVYLAKAELSANKESLSLAFKQKDEKELSLFEQLNADEHIESATGRSILIFSPLPAADGPDMTEAKRFDRAFSDVNSIKGQLIHIMKQYMVKDDAKLGDAYFGTGIDEANLTSKLVQKPILHIVFNNMVQGFLEKMKPFFGKTDPQYLMRLLLIRQSKEKHYPTLRKRFLEESPFLELMVIPKEESKVAFTPYEIREKLDSADEIPKESADPASAAPAKTATEIFGPQSNVQF